MKNLLKPNLDLALLLVRLALGLGFLVHGVGKLQHIQMTIDFFGSKGLPPSMAYLVGLTESIGGLAMILGLFTQYAGLALSAVMVGAILLVKVGMYDEKGYTGMEIDVMYLAASLAIAFAGAGKYSIKIPGMTKSPMPEPKQQ